MALHLKSTGIDFTDFGHGSGTMASELMDDYEEGTWTPVLGGQSGSSGQTYVAQHGSYTKVGRLVGCSWYVNLGAKGTISGSLVMADFPFTCANNQRSVAALGYISEWTISSGHHLTNFMEHSTTLCYMMESEQDGSDGVIYLTTSHIGGTTKLMGNITYEA